MKIVVVGYGLMGERYLKKLLELGVPKQDVYIWDTNPERIAACRREFGIQPPYEARLDAAIIASTPASHHTVIRDLYEHGVRMFLCEKPLAISLEAARQIPNGARVYVGFIARFSDPIRRLVELMQKEGLLLAELALQWYKNRVDDPRPSGGCLTDESTHGEDLARWLIGLTDRIASTTVTAHLPQLRYVNAKNQAEDARHNSHVPMNPNSSALMLTRHSLQSGRVVGVSMYVSFVAAQQSRRVQGVLVNREGVPVKSFDIEFDGYGKDSLLVTTLDTKHEERTAEKVDTILEQLKAFLRVVQDRVFDPRLVTFGSAMVGMQMIELALQSHALGRSCTLEFPEEVVCTPG